MRVAVLVVILSSIPLGGIAGLLVPGIDADRVGPMRLAAYVMPYVTMLVPNIVVLGGLFFCIAAMTRRMLPVYIASVVLLIGYLAARGLLRDIDNKTLASMLDPFGVTANSTLTEYWSISERNTRLVPLEGVLLWNRLLWMSIGRRRSGVLQLPVHVHAACHATQDGRRKPIRSQAFERRRPPR